MRIRIRDLLAIVETVGPYLSDKQIGEEIDRLLQLAGSNAPEMPFDIERARDERELCVVARRESA
jgi:hypothetical protein